MIIIICDICPQLYHDGKEYFFRVHFCIFVALFSLPLSLRLFSGTLVHGLVRYLKGGRNAESLLPGGSLSAQLYSSLLNAMRNCSSKATHSSSESGRRGRGRGQGGRGRGRGRRGRGGRGGRGAQGGGRDANEINNRFALLMSEEESDDDDEDY